MTFCANLPIRTTNRGSRIHRNTISTTTTRIGDTARRTAASSERFMVKWDNSSLTRGWAISRVLSRDCGSLHPQEVHPRLRETTRGVGSCGIKPVYLRLLSIDSGTRLQGGKTAGEGSKDHLRDAGTSESCVRNTGKNVDLYCPYHPMNVAVRMSHMPFVRSDLKQFLPISRRKFLL